MMRCLGLVAISLSWFAGTAFASDTTVRFSSVTGGDGVKLNVAEAGDAGRPGILFVHGNGQSYLSWSRQLESPLADRFHLVAFDLRGHGASDKPWAPEMYTRACAWADDVSTVIAAAKLERPVMVAWSFGGAVAMHYIRCAGSDGLAGLVLVGSRGGLVKVALPDADSAARQSRELMKSEAFDDFARGADMFSQLMTAAPPDAARARDQVAMNIMVPAYVRRAMDQPVAGPDGQTVRSNGDLVGKLRIPFAVVLGSADPFRDTAELATAFRSQMPRAEVNVIDGAGHSPFYEKAGEFNALLDDFANRAHGIRDAITP